MPKKKKKTPVQLLQEENEDLWKEIICLRDGKKCMVQELFPNIDIKHTDIYQADHCFTRGNKHLFLDTCNGTMVCSSCNMAKHYDNKSVKRAVDIIVIQREGEEKFQDMMSIDMKRSANLNWNKIWWLEEQRDLLKQIKEELLKKEEENG